MSRRGDSNIIRLLREALANTPEKDEELAVLTQEINRARGLNGHGVEIIVNGVNHAGFNKVEQFTKYAFEATWWNIRKQGQNR